MATSTSSAHQPLPSCDAGPRVRTAGPTPSLTTPCPQGEPRPSHQVLLSKLLMAPELRLCPLLVVRTFPGWRCDVQRPPYKLVQWAPPTPRHRELSVQPAGMWVHGREGATRGPAQPPLATTMGELAPHASGRRWNGDRSEGRGDP